MRPSQNQLYGNPDQLPSMVLFLSIPDPQLTIPKAFEKIISQQSILGLWIDVIILSEL